MSDVFFISGKWIIWGLSLSIPQIRFTHCWVFELQPKQVQTQIAYCLGLKKCNMDVTNNQAEQVIADLSESVEETERHARCSEHRCHLSPPRTIQTFEILSESEGRKCYRPILITCIVLLLIVIFVLIIATPKPSQSSKLAWRALLSVSAPPPLLPLRAVPLQPGALKPRALKPGASKPARDFTFDLVS